MQTSIGRRALLGAGVAAAALPRRTHAADKPIRIGVLTDMTGAYAANTGPGSVLGAQMAVEDFMQAHPGIKAEVVQADLQLKPDVALAIAADWYDNKGVDVVTDVPLSSAAFAIGDLAKQKDKVAIFTGGASADITGAHCGPNHLHWVYDTWSMPHGVVDAAVKEGAEQLVLHHRRLRIRPLTAEGCSELRDCGRWQSAWAGLGAVPWHHRLLLVPGAGTGKRCQGDRARQRRQRHGELHQAGRGIRHHEGRPEGRRPDLPDPRRARRRSRRRHKACC